MYFIEEMPGKSCLVYLGECGDTVLNLILRLTGGKNVSFVIDRHVYLDPVLFTKYIVNVQDRPMKCSIEFLEYMYKWIDGILDKIANSDTIR
jgi:hypothetical protein